MSSGVGSGVATITKYPIITSGRVDLFFNSMRVMCQICARDRIEVKDMKLYLVSSPKAW